MDDTTQRLSAMFPIGDTTVTVREPTGAQMLVLSLSRTPKQAGTEMGRLIKRMFRILEGLMGQEQWDTVIEEGVADETLSANDLLGLVEEVLAFPWADHHKAPEPEATAVSAVEAPTEAPPARPAPRIVNGA